MSVTLRFLSFLRSGFARSIASAADAKTGLPKTTRASVDLVVRATGAEIVKTVNVRGPESVLGLAESTVLRCFPSPDEDDHPPNLFPFLELGAPDLPWLFTGAAPAGERLAPWLVLAVVEDRSGVRLDARAHPCPVLSVDDASRELPALDEAWAWAHVQALADTTDLARALKNNAEAFSARLVCPRLLEANKSYLACAVPVFEAGRAAGLGMTPSEDRTALAWTKNTQSIELPVYYSWRFTTSPESADFEELVRRLRPHALSKGTGVHALDVAHPGTTRLPNIPGAVSFVGALRAPELDLPEWRDPHRGAFQRAMSALLAAQSTTREDPVVGPPRYGATYSTTAPWSTELNLDPRHRAAAGLGAEVVRRNQESLMAAAWDQARGADGVRALFNRTLLAAEVGARRKSRLDALADGALVQLTAGAHARMASDANAETVLGSLAKSAVPPALISAAFQRTARRAGSDAPRAVTERFLSDPQRELTCFALTTPQGTMFADEQPAAHARPQEKKTIDFARLEAHERAHFSAALNRFERKRRLRPKIRKPDAAEPRAPRGPATPHTATPYTATPNTAPIGIADQIRRAIDPVRDLRARLLSVVRPASVVGESGIPKTLAVELSLEEPLYRLLAAIDPELLLPGAGALRPDSVGLAVIEQTFIEALVLGANDELRRELMWREYPAALDGSWMHTFWDHAGVTDVLSLDAWTRGALGAHANPAIDPARTLVLLLKGDLLRRYPNTLISAVPARWIDARREEDTSAEPVLPSFAGKLGRDVFFLGFLFDSSIAVPARLIGNSDQRQHDPGWFFAFEQPATEPCFGVDTAESDTSDALGYWKDLSARDVRGSAADTHVALSVLEGKELAYDFRGDNRWKETWGRSAAAMARITLQRPVRMLVHADQMIISEGDDHGE